MNSGRDKIVTDAESRSDSDDVPLIRSLRGPLGVAAVAGMGLLLLGVFYTIYFARAFVLPVVVALLLHFVLTPVVRALRRIGIPSWLGAGLILFGFVASVGYGVYRLSGPAGQWIDRAPEELRQAELKLRALKKPVQAIQEAGEQVERIADVDGRDETSDGAAPQVEMPRAAIADTILDQTQQFILGSTIVLFLLYFLLASGDLFLRKLVRSLPTLSQKRRAVIISRRTERQLTHYLFTRTAINVVLGAAVGFALWLIGLPNPILWGAMAAVLNYVPYLGAAVGYVVVGLAALVTFDSLGRALLAPGIYFVLNAIEGNLVTPLVLGRTLTLNPVVLFAWLIFWGWMWGIPGALLAVPLLTMLKIVADNVPPLTAVGEFLGA